MVFDTFERNIEEKEMLVLKDFVVNHHLSKIEEILKKETLISAYISDKLAGEIRDQLILKAKASEKIRHYSAYLLEPQQFKPDDSVGKKCKEEIEGEIIELGREIIKNTQFPSDVKTSQVIRNFIGNWQKILFQDSFQLNSAQVVHGYFIH